LDFLLKGLAYLPAITFGLCEIEDLKIFLEFKVAGYKRVLAVYSHPSIPEIELDVGGGRGIEGRLLVEDQTYLTEIVSSWLYLSVLLQQFLH
jgi:hypothetical protein